MFRTWQDKNSSPLSFSYGLYLGQRETRVQNFSFLTCKHELLDLCLGNTSVVCGVVPIRRQLCLGLVSGCHARQSTKDCAASYNSSLGLVWATWRTQRSAVLIYCLKEQLNFLHQAV